jgi:hypothetical protein
VFAKKLLKIIVRVCVVVLNICVTSIVMVFFWGGGDIVCCLNKKEV